MQNNNVSEMPRETLISEVRAVIVNAVGLHHLDPAEIKAETSLREGGLELDSVDILEVVVMIEQRFSTKVENAEAGKKAFKTIGSIADFLQAQNPKQVN